MQVTPTQLPDVLLCVPKVFGDERGYFLETFQAERYENAGIPGPFVQDNLSHSSHGILRGLHLQHPNAQGKLVYVLAGEVFDVAVDVRVGSPNFGRFASATLNGDNRHQLYIPPGFAHGFCVTSERATFAYKCTEYYSPSTELSVLYDDPDLGVPWPIEHPKLSDKDRAGLRLRDIPRERLPTYHAP